MKKKILIACVAATLVLGSLAACKKGEEKPAGTPIADLIAAGKAPIEAGAMSKGISPVAPTFTMAVTNLSSSPISAIGGTVIFFDTEGKALPDTIADAGYADISPIPPGGKIELQIMTPNEKAVTGKWILKDVLYEKANPMGKEYGTLPFKWTNPGYAAALEAEKAK
ncbi:MAG: hypothetical protein NTZ26_15650 [Candidatus Aminicenantes bacterium]|nr:hypothetical protein [Candidatus Aminicenantes bacterium]